MSAIKYITGYIQNTIVIPPQLFGSHDGPDFTDVPAKLEKQIMQISNMAAHEFVWTEEETAALEIRSKDYIQAQLMTTYKNANIVLLFTGKNEN